MSDSTDPDFEDDPLDLSRYPYLEAQDALVIAAGCGDGRLVDYLLECGHDINIRDEDGRTGLYAAVDQTFYALAIHLLERGADPNIPDNQGDTPLDIAKYSYLYKERGDTEMVDALVKAGGTSKEGPSARELLDDQVHDGFSKASAMKTLLSRISQDKKR